MFFSTPSPGPDHYEVLGVSYRADEAAIKRAWRRIAKDSHPDLNPEDEEATARFRRAAEAYEVLNDPVAKACYDWSLPFSKKVGGGWTPPPAPEPEEPEPEPAPENEGPDPFDWEEPPAPEPVVEYTPWGEVIEPPSPPPAPREPGPDDEDTVLTPRQARELSAAFMSIETLTQEIEDGFAQIKELQEVDAIFGGYTRRRGEILESILPLIVAREQRLRAERKRQRAGWTEIEYSPGYDAGNPFKRNYVIARCIQGSGVSGMVWGCSPRSIKRALATVSESCDCGARFHRDVRQRREHGGDAA